VSSGLDDTAWDDTAWDDTAWTTSGDYSRPAFPVQAAV